jgi:hypothetical protein
MLKISQEIPISSAMVWESDKPALWGIYEKDHIYGAMYDSL